MSDLQNFIKKTSQKLQKYVLKPWYPPLMACLAAADAFFVVIPTDGLVISSSMTAPKRWIHLSIWSAAGSTVGGLILAYLASYHGLPWVEAQFPNLVSSSSWQNIHELWHTYGMLFFFGYASTPLPQQPAILIAGLAETHFLPLAIAMFLGRAVKFSMMGYAGAKAPWLLNKMWGMSSELKEVGIETPTESSDPQNKTKQP